MEKKWAYEKCKEIALQFKTRKELKEQFYQVHYKIYKKKWHELLQHMKPLASKKHRCVYCYVFNDGATYVGLTCDHNRRDKEHRECGPVYNYHVENSLSIPKMVLLTEYINFSDAAQIETNIIEELKEKGIKVLNRERGGGLGSWASEKVTEEECISNIKKCGSKTELRKRFYPSYLYLKDHFAEMETTYKNFWTQNSKCTKIVSFTENGHFYKEFDKINDAITECGTKNVSEACREHYYTNGFYFLRYDEWTKLGKPNKVLSKEEKSKKKALITIEKRRLTYSKYGNPQTGKKRSINQRMKIGIPVVMATLNNEFIDVFYNISFAIEKYGLNRNLGKCIHKVRDNQLKSAYGYRWYTLEYYNKTFNKNIKL